MITITDIQKASGVGRATFYRSFDNINDVLYWQCALHYLEVMTGYLREKEKHEGPEDPYAFLTFFFSYWMHDETSRILAQLITTISSTAAILTAPSSSAMLSRQKMR